MEELKKFPVDFGAMGRDVADTDKVPVSKNENGEMVAVPILEIIKKSVKLTGNETIAGTKTFDASPIVPTPTEDGGAVNKGMLDKKPNSIIGKNKLNPAASDIGHFIWSWGDIGDNEVYATSDFIPVSGNMIMNLAQLGGTGNKVYNAAKVELRIFTTPHYVFEAGDAFVRYSYDVRTQCQIEVGDEATIFEPFTEKGDVIERILNLENATPIEYGVDDIKVLVSPASNGLVPRKYGFDIPIGSSGNGSLTYLRFPNVAGKFKCDFYAISNIPASQFYIDGSWGFTVAQESVGILKFTKLIADSSSIFEIQIYPSGTDTAVTRYFRFSNLIITPIDFESSKNLSKKQPISNRKVIEVCKFFTSGTTSFGVTRFSSIINAHNSIVEPYFPSDSKFAVRLMPGFYDEFETVWAGSDGETSGDYKGIIAKNNVNYESFDVDVPELTILKWDGHAGFTSGHVMDTPNQAMTRCIFHIIHNPVITEINGFKIISKNTRYCVHPESASTGNGNSWKLKNLILDWGGRPNVDSEGGCHIGIGISSGEIGYIENVKMIGILGLGIAGHNNGWSIQSQGALPFIVPSARLFIKNTDFNGRAFRIDTYHNDATTNDMLELDNVVNITTAEFGFTGGATVQNWKATKKGCSITTDNLIY